MNEILTQITVIHCRRIQQYEAIMRGKHSLNAGEIEKLIFRYIQSETNRQLSENRWIIRLCTWTQVEGFERIVFKRWTQKMLEVLRLPNQIIEQMYQQESLLTAYLYMFNSRGEFTRSAQIQSLKLRISSEKCPCFMILADKLLNFIRENLLKNLHQTSGSQPILLRSSKLQLRGENCQVAGKSQSKEYKTPVKKFSLRLRNIRGISSTVKTQYNVIKPLFNAVFSGRQNSFRSSFMIKTSNSTRLNTKPSISLKSESCQIYNPIIVPSAKLKHYNKIMDLQLEEEKMDKKQLYNCLLQRNRSNRAEIEKYRKSSIKARGLLRFRRVRTELKSHIAEKFSRIQQIRIEQDI